MTAMTPWPRPCDLCRRPVPDDVVPAETLDGKPVLECMTCWMVRMEEPDTLRRKVCR